MKIIDYRRGEAEGGILVNGEKSYIAVTASTSKKFKSLRGAQKFLESYGYRAVKSRIGSSSAVDQYLKNNPSASLAKITVDMVLGKDTDLTVRGLSSFTFSFEGESPESVRKIKKFFGRKAKIEGEYDKDTDMTYIYMDIPSKKSSIKGPNECNSRSPLVRGFHDEWYVVIEHNYARRTNRVVDYSTRKGDMLDSVMRKIDAYAFETNDSDLIKRIDRSKSAEDFLEKNASKYSWGYNTDIYGDNGWEIIRLTKENFEELGEQYPDIYDRFSEEDFE